MRVKKYKIMPYVRLSTVILFLFTCRISSAVVYDGILEGSGGVIPESQSSSHPSSADPYVDPYNYFKDALSIDVTPFEEETLDAEWSDFQVSLNVSYSRDLDSLINEIGRIIVEVVDEFYSELHSKLDEIDFNLAIIEDKISEWNRLYGLARANSYPVSSDFMEVYRDLTEKKNTLLKAKEKLESQISEIDNFHDMGLNLNIDFPEWAPSVLERIQNFSAEISSSISSYSDSDLQDKRQAISKQLDYIGTQRDIISHSKDTIRDYL
ncbi:MAG: hypothetical protein B6D53_02670, partial [Candidatus Omnitrophica bacterium 4484_49]